MRPRRSASGRHGDRSHHGLSIDASRDSGTSAADVTLVDDAAIDDVVTVRDTGVMRDVMGGMPDVMTAMPDVMGMPDVNSGMPDVMSGVMDAGRDADSGSGRDAGRNEETGRADR